MRVVFYLNIVSPHQLPLAREVAKRVGVENFIYIYAEDFHAERASMGWNDKVEGLRVEKLSDANRQLLEDAEFLYTGIRCLDLLNRRAARGLKSYYYSERWFKPIAIRPFSNSNSLLQLLLPGIIRMLVPGYRRMAKGFVRWLNSDPNARYLAVGPWAKKDMLRIGVREDKIVDWGYFVAPSTVDANFCSRPQQDQSSTVDLDLKHRPSPDLDLRPRPSLHLHLPSTPSLHLDLRPRPSPVKVLYIGRLIPLKRVDTIIRAVALANERVVGDSRSRRADGSRSDCGWAPCRGGDGEKKIGVENRCTAEEKKVGQESRSTADGSIPPHIDLTQRHRDTEGHGEVFEKGAAQGLGCNPSSKNLCDSLCPRASVLKSDRRAMAEKKVEEWLAGVDEATFEAALVKLVEEKTAAGEYRFRKPEERELALEGARKFYREFARKIVPLSDGRYVYFAPDERAKVRNASNAISWAEYAFHAVSNGGAKVSGKNYNERWYNPHKQPAFALIEGVLKREKCFIRLSSADARFHAIVFAGTEDTSARLQVVTRLDDAGNIDANLSEVTFTASRKEKKLPRLVPLTEAVRTVVHYQTATGSYPPNGNSIAFSPNENKGGGERKIGVENRCTEEFFDSGRAASMRPPRGDESGVLADRALPGDESSSSSSCIDLTQRHRDTEGHGEVFEKGAAQGLGCNPSSKNLCDSLCPRASVLKFNPDLLSSPSFTLTIVGDGPEKERLQKLANKYSLINSIRSDEDVASPVDAGPCPRPNKPQSSAVQPSTFNLQPIIAFLPSVPISSVRSLMRQHDVLVFASNALDGWGAVVSEALAEGVPVIGTYETGASAALLPDTQLFHSGDYRALARKLRCCFVRSDDEHTLARPSGSASPNVPSETQAFLRCIFASPVDAGPCPRPQQDQSSTVDIDLQPRPSPDLDLRPRPSLHLHLPPTPLLSTLPSAYTPSGAAERLLA